MRSLYGLLKVLRLENILKHWRRKGIRSKNKYSPSLHFALSAVKFPQLNKQQSVEEYFIFY